MVARFCVIGASRIRLFELVDRKVIDNYRTAERFILSITLRQSFPSPDEGLINGDHITPGWPVDTVRGRRPGPRTCVRADPRIARPGLRARRSRLRRPVCRRGACR